MADRWTAAEDAVLKADTLAKVNRKETARKLGRSYQAVRGRAHALNLTGLPTGPIKQRMPQEVTAEAVRLRKAGAPFRIIAKTLGVPISTVFQGVRRVITQQAEA